MDIFYHAMYYASKGIIDASCCEAFQRRSAEEVRQLIEDLAKCNYKAPSEALGSSSRLKESGLIELNRMTAIEAKLDAVMNKLGSNERRIHTAHEVGAVKEGIRSSTEGPVEEEPHQVEETKQRSYHFKPNPNLPLIWWRSTAGPQTWIELPSGLRLTQVLRTTAAEGQ